jgi:HAD superfamily hydrolase (TIGR01509 family)
MENIMTAILFGSISTLAETSELQRAAFNAAFAQHGLAWQWDRDDYRTMLAGNGGAARIAAFAATRGESVDADAVHATKSAIFQQSLAAALPRDGVVDTITRAKAAGTKLGFVTTTSAENIAALFAALAPAVQRSDFDVVVTADDVTAPKPDPQAYRFALRTLNEEPTSCVAVEDNVGGARSAASAGVRGVAFPNENTTEQDFEGIERTDRLDFDTLIAAASRR